ncbi:MAG TPA: arylamine N-acetyltransferase [Sphingomonas sp.]|nr:arylamine N-acetyltransferase [Sphingomonas sp.]
MESRETLTPARLAAYLDRIGLAAAPAADAAGLARVHQAHRRAIPFENLDIPLGRGVSLDPDRLFAKLVTARRGGYCFEQNGLFLRALRALGFTARPLLGRVWMGSGGEAPPRTHTLNLVSLPDGDWIADAGFGGSDAPPMRLMEQEVATPDGVRHRLARDAEHGWMLTRDGEPQYSFTEERVWPSDLALSNHWTSTVPGGRFVTMRIASILAPEGLIALTGTRLSTPEGAIEIADPATYRETLASRFGIALDEAEVAALGLFGAEKQ